MTKKSNLKKTWEKNFKKFKKMNPIMQVLIAAFIFVVLYFAVKLVQSLIWWIVIVVVIYLIYEFVIKKKKK